MSGEAAIELGALALVLVFPFGLLAAMWGLGALERWMLSPSEHAEELSRLLADEDPETIESAVASMLAENADRPGKPVQTTQELKRRARRRLYRSRGRLSE